MGRSGSPFRPLCPYSTRVRTEWGDVHTVPEKREGFAADVVFDPATVSDRSTFDEGRALAVGVEHVLVNGELVLHAGKRTPALPGRALRRGR